MDTAYLNGRTPEMIAQQLCDGGSDLIQLRAKRSSLEEIRRMAEAILPITRRAGVALVINDYPEIAKAVGAEFCHLGQEDFFDRAHGRVREISGKQFAQGQIRIGLSSHAPEQARRAIEAGADYLAVGPVYKTATKPGSKPVTVEYVQWAAQNVKTPWFAIGGIHLKNLDEVLAAGARRICVVSAILNTPDPGRACEEFKKHLAH